MGYTEFYVTKGASANDLNGGAPLGANDGPTVARTTVTATQISGATHNLECVGGDNGAGWGAAGVGDFLCFDTASAKIRARITTLAVGGDTDIIQVVRIDGSTASFAAASKAVRVGGAFATINGAVSLARATWTNAGGDPPRINVAGSYTESPTAGYAGTAGSPITIQGYTSTPGDLGVATITGKLTLGYNYWVARDLSLTKTVSGAALDGSAGNYHVYERIAAAGYDYGIYFATYTRLLNCRVTAGYNGYYGAAAVLLGCTVTGAAYGFRCTYGATLLACAAYANSNHGAYIQYDGPIVIANCSLIGNTGSGIYLDTLTFPPVVSGSVLYGNSGYGLAANAALLVAAQYNAFGSNTSGARSNVGAAGLGDINLTGNPCVASGSGDLRIDPRTAAGRQLVAAGFPQTLGGQSAGWDIGALQTRVRGGWIR